MVESSLGIKIESDFKDYYDVASTDSNYVGVYARYMTGESRGKSLRWLREQGIKTVELRAAREYDDTVRELVVYTNPNLHDSLGKQVVTLSEARTLYANHLASPFYAEANGETLKFLQLGTRRFRLRLKSEKSKSLLEGTVLDMVELESVLNYSVMQPIFSIDYIFNGKEMIAVDLNRVQRLDKLGLEHMINPAGIISEIKKALIAYNKI